MFREEATAMRRMRMANPGCVRAFCTLAQDMESRATVAWCSCSSGGSRVFTNLGIHTHAA